MPVTVLLVDDEPMVLEGLVQTLRKTPYTVKTASSPEEALELLRSLPIDIVVSDHMMPGMNGVELLSLVHDRHPDAVRILLTGHASMEAAVKAINEGEIYRFLSKPCDPAELLVALHLACEKLELERENRMLRALVRSSPELSARLDEMGDRRGRGGTGPR